jgi:hypothetical protein
VWQHETTLIEKLLLFGGAPQTFGGARVCRNFSATKRARDLGLLGHESSFHFVVDR